MRHRRGHHCAGAFEFNDRKYVLNALRHRRGHHGGDGDGQRNGFQVLNALRHRRGHHLVRESEGLRNSLCSTPCGIGEVITGRSRRCRCSRRCAQRLAASERSSQDHGRLGRVVGQVLNALRHRRGHHSLPGRCLRIQSRAQRLAASERSSLHPSHPSHSQAVTTAVFKHQSDCG